MNREYSEPHRKRCLQCGEAVEGVWLRGELCLGCYDRGLLAKDLPLNPTADSSRPRIPTPGAPPPPGDAADRVRWTPEEEDAGVRPSERLRDASGTVPWVFPPPSVGDGPPEPPPGVFVDDRTPARDLLADDRPNWDAYYLALARTVATRGTCDRKRVGCVVVGGGVVLATGYNGAVRGLVHCTAAGHDLEDGHCARVVHAEANAVANAARVGARLAGSTAYVSARPCWGCFKLLVAAGIGAVTFGDDYRPDPRVETAARSLGIALRKEGGASGA